MKVSDSDILATITKNQVKDQAELVTLLEQNGFNITQASLSRRLKKLGVQKIDGFYQASGQQGAKRFHETVISIDTAPPNLIVIRTLPGSASYTADFLDDIIESPEEFDPTGKYKGMIGTVAGDDTIMVIINDPARLETIADLINT